MNYTKATYEATLERLAREIPVDYDPLFAKRDCLAFHVITELEELGWDAIKDKEGWYFTKQFAQISATQSIGVTTAKFDWEIEGHTLAIMRAACHALDITERGREHLRDE